MNVVKVGLLGLGTVGSGTVNVLTRNKEEIARRIGCQVEVIIASARDINKPRDCDLTGVTLTTDSNEVVNHPDVDVVVELIGGYDLAKALVLKAIQNGKHVVTANKALIAVHGNEVFEEAQKHNVTVMFEAAVAGGIPIIKSVREGLAGNRINWLAGIINGTGNFILTEMRDKGRPFNDVLAEAQELGYAEADPTFDVEGIDAAHKLTILASLAYGIPLQFDKAFTEGISKVTTEDVEYAEQLGYRIKHLGIAKKTENGIELRVHPTLLPERHLLANVNGVMNAVIVHGDAVGQTLSYGAGAGAEPTASAVVADVIDVVREMQTAHEHRVPGLAFQAGNLSDEPIAAMDDIKSAYYLRLEASDEPGVLADITRILADQDISIEAILQKEPLPSQTQAQVIMLTGLVKEVGMNNAISAIEALSTVNGQVTKIRVEHFDD